MKNNEGLMIRHSDLEKISTLLRGVQLQELELLEEELSRATAVPDGELPNDVVAMNSVVRFQDLETGKESVVTLVYPFESDPAEGRISILSPVGSALIGLRVGQVIQWPFPNGKEKKLKVMGVDPGRYS